ncbi:MAG: ATP-dependent DNA helicase RecQ [Sandaracinus sp.]
MSDLDQRLQERFGLPSFRPWQEEAIRALLEGPGRALVIAPTGGGKSLTYQFPATELPGTTIVVSPLIALMDDQVRGLEARGIAATYLASTLDPDVRRQRERELAEGKYRLVYVAPERLGNAALLDRLKQLRAPLVAIDEAHCISQWGHDFRPDYLRLGEVLRELGAPRVLACTATATPMVREEILEKLGLDPASTAVVLRGFARPNLHLAAEEVDSPGSRRSAMTRVLKDALGPASRPAGGAIVYAATRRGAEDTARRIAALGYRAAAYHAGLPAQERARVSEAFATRTVDVVAATNAFGMGIDRPDVRAVVHVSPPGSIEAYYQEVGRAGRDGKPAFGLLLSSSSDIALRRRMVERGPNDSIVDPAEVKRQWNLFRDLLRYVEAGSCRHDFILRYFDDDEELLGGCGHCDVCERLEQGGAKTAASDEDALVVRKALSGVARADRRAGMQAVANMLHGLDDEKQARLGFTRLSTHGLLRDRSAEWVLALLRRLVTAGLVDLTTGDLPCPYLTATGVRAMRGDDPIRVLLPDAVVSRADRRRAAAVAGPRAATGSLAGAELAIFERLRTVRRELAEKQGVPPYVVCHDRTLVEIARAKPKSRIELGAVHGMGPARLSSYGDVFLQAVGSS